MKPSLIGGVVFFGIMFMVVAKADTERYGRAEAANKNGSITAVHRLSNGQSWLVLRKDNADLLKIPATALLINLEDAWLQDGQLAVVLDSDLSLTYQLYSLQGGNWKLQRQTAFYPLNVSTRASLILVQMPNLTDVILSCAKKGDVARVSGVTNPDDPKITFKFATDGSVLKDGRPYRLKSDGESQ